MPEQQNAKLPSPYSVFRPDPHAERFARVAIVEQQLLAEHGFFHVPDREGRLVYYGHGIDAQVQRRRAAWRIVEMEERIERLAHRPMTPRELAARQREVLDQTGVLTSGYDEVA